MATNYRELEQMTDEELINQYDQTAAHTSVGLAFLQDELARRKNEKESMRMLKISENSLKVAWISLIVTVVFSIITAILAVFQIFSTPNPNTPIPNDDAPTTADVAQETRNDVVFAWPVDGMIPATPLNPIKTFGEVPEEFKAGLPEFKVDYTDELQAFRKGLAEKYGIDIYYVGWLGTTSWGDAVQIEREEPDEFGMNLKSDIVIFKGPKELQRFPFDGGKATSVVAEGDTLIVESIYFAGIFAMPIMRSSVPHARERVISGYDRSGKLLWRGAEQLWYTDENGQAFESPPIRQ